MKSGHFFLALVVVVGAQGVTTMWLQQAQEDQFDARFETIATAISAALGQANSDLARPLGDPQANSISCAAQARYVAVGAEAFERSQPSPESPIEEDGAERVREDQAPRPQRLLTDDELIESLDVIDELQPGDALASEQRTELQRRLATATFAQHQRILSSINTAVNLRQVDPRTFFP